MTARAVPPGTTLTAPDVRVDHVPASLLPAGAPTRADDVVGRRATVALPEGTLLQDGLVAGGELAAGAPDGTVVAPVRLDPGVAALLGPGDRVDLLAAGDPALAPVPTDVADAGTAPRMIRTWPVPRSSCRRPSPTTAEGCSAPVGRAPTS